MEGIPSIKDWPASRIEKQEVTSLIPYANNARTHSEEQVSQIAASMKEWGWTNPVLVDEGGTIIAGHGRILAAQRLGIEKVPVMVAKGWSEAQKKAYTLADNKLAENAGWDTELLGIELEGLSELEFDLSLIGFDESELAGLERHEGLTDPDEVPDTPVNPTSRQGDLWKLGKHFVYCGDCTSPEAVTALLQGVEPHLMVTDPPYGVEYDAKWRNRVNGKLSMATGAVTNDDCLSWQEAWALFPGDVAYIWHGFQQCPVTAYELQGCGLELRALIVWSKSVAPISRGDYHHQHETCWYAVRKGRKGHYCGGRKQSTVWEIDKPMKSETGHSTQKPVECMKRPIVNNSSPGQAVYDPFLGSGTTVIAAEMEARCCYGLEIEPAYVDVTIERWQNFTGEKATLGDKTFEEMTNERYDAAKDGSDSYLAGIEEKRRELESAGRGTASAAQADEGTPQAG